LTIALRHVVRKQHDNGEGITFPVPDAVDRISFRRQGLPTDTLELMRLIKEVFARREEAFELEEVYLDFVRAHGNVLLDPKEPWPHCYVHTRFPT